MDHYRASPSMSSSASSSADFSSPALPELSLDASLQRLHQQEDISASSLSSVALSRAWLCNTNHQQNNSSRTSSSSSSSSSDSPVGHHTTQAANAERKLTFRFPPPLTTPHEAQRQSPPPLNSAISTIEPALPARPRTSRGLIHPKPFLSSSRATSIASIAEVEPDQAGPKIVFGTPFAGNAFDQRRDDFPDTDEQFRRYSDSSASVGSRFSPKHTYIPIEEKKESVETRRPHASTTAAAEVANSGWTILFAPLQQGKTSEEDELDEAQDSILLPLLSSLEDQVEHLKSHLSKNSSSNQGSLVKSDIECFLDLSSVSVLPSTTLARLTPRSWSLAFDRFSQKESGKPDGTSALPLPYLYRETGLPIVALIRYTIVPRSMDESHSRMLANLDRTSSQAEPRATRLDLQTQDSNPWTRRESEMTVSLTDTGRLAASPMMVPSRSYPGNPRTPVRKSPLPYSPRTTAFSRDSARPLVDMALEVRGSPTSHSFSNQEFGNRTAEGNKLRSLSLAVAHPLSPIDSKAGQKTTSQLASGMTFGIDPQEEAQHDVKQQHPSSPTRQRYPSSRGSSQKSFPSHTTSLSTHSTRSTSIYSTRSRHLTGNESDIEEDTDADLGSRFWTQLSSLGEQVSRENKGVSEAHEAAVGRRRNSRNVSISSTASDASVFDYSPLGILVPSDGAFSTPGRDESSPHVSGGVSEAFKTLHNPLTTGAGVGRRRAYSSMIPMTGWKAGDSDMMTVEGQRNVAAIGDLPQVLMVDSSDNVGNGDSGDLITPTVATFQGRTRALSFQPAGTASMRSASDPIACGGRGEVWEEALNQLAERLNRPSQPLEPVNVVKQLDTATSSKSLLDPAPSTSSNTQAPKEPSSNTSTDFTSPPIQSSPLPGLFYDTWVERVDGAIDGDLGRRGSTFQSSPTGTLALAQDNRTLGAEMAGGMTRTSSSSSSSGSTMLGSTGSVHVLHESEWPRPVWREDRLMPTSASFLSVFSPRDGDQDSDEEEREDMMEDLALEDNLARRSEAHSRTSLNSVRPSRSHTVSAPHPASNVVATSSDVISGWADLAQRLRSPGSMRLLCLAAANWTPNDSDAPSDELQLDTSTGFDTLPTGLAVPFAPLARSQSLNGLIRTIDSWKADLIVPPSPSPPTDITVKEDQPRRLTRKKAALLGPIHIPRSSLSQDPQVGLQPKAITRVKRSLSNIFDLSSPVRPDAALDSM
ncbi:uncharacterized protein UTRI_05976_B [Ustilago trichophora]|uniref:Uncharacterized protein n=1 Tax=Ustilago trichophora TaxID=86804 RepID=A0A5C3EKQ8_9BASI|nr:uncharacterized protein UTRI_05976_B [Ustilago trichophora]